MRRPRNEATNSACGCRRTARSRVTAAATMRRPRNAGSRSRRTVSTSGSSGNGRLRTQAAQGLPRVARGGLLGLLLRAAATFALEVRADEDLGLERLGVVGAF